MYIYIERGREGNESAAASGKYPPPTSVCRYWFSSGAPAIPSIYTDFCSMICFHLTSTPIQQLGLHSAPARLLSLSRAQEGGEEKGEREREELRRSYLTVILLIGFSLPRRVSSLARRAFPLGVSACSGERRSLVTRQS